MSFGTEGGEKGFDPFEVGRRFVGGSRSVGFTHG